MNFDIEKARKQGNSEADILAHLSEKHKDSFNFVGAKELGYEDADIIKHLTAKPAQESPLGATGDPLEGVIPTGGVPEPTPSMERYGADIGRPMVDAPDYVPPGVEPRLPPEVRPVKADWGEVAVEAPIKSVIPSIGMMAGGLEIAGAERDLEKLDYTETQIKMGTFPGQEVELKKLNTRRDKILKERQEGVALFRGAKETMADIQPDVEYGTPKYYVGAALQSVAQMAPSLTASIATGNPLPTMTYMGMASGGIQYGELIEAGIDPQTARYAALGYALAEGVPEALPVGVLLKGGKTATRILKTMGAETVQEEITEALQMAIDKGTINPDMTWKEAKQRFKDVAIISPIAGGVMAGATQPFVGKAEAPPIEPITPKSALPTTSPVVEEIKEPVRVYHGTDKEFETFDIKETADGIIWFTDKKELIEKGEVGASGKGVIKEVDLDLKNPAGWEEYDKYSIDELVNKGYDGLKLVEEDQTTYAAFEPEQIKTVKPTTKPVKKVVKKEAVPRGTKPVKKMVENGHKEKQVFRAEKEAAEKKELLKVEREAQEPEELTRESVDKEEVLIKSNIAKLTKSQQVTLDQIQYEVENGEKGSRRKGFADPSTFPVYFQNKGYTKKETLRAIDKVKAGEELGTRQTDIISDLIYSARMEEAIESERLKPAKESVVTGELPKKPLLGGEKGEVSLEGIEEVPGRVKKAVTAVKEFFTPFSTIPQANAYEELRYKTLGKLDRVEGVISKIWKRTKDLPSEQKKQLFDFLAGRIEKTALPMRLQPMAVSLRTQHNLVGQMLVKRGLMTQETYEENKDSYIKFMYLKHLEGGPKGGGRGLKLGLSYQKGRMDAKIKEITHGTEYVDKAVYEALLGVTNKLGIKHTRKAKVRGHALGLASKAGKMETQFATDVQVIAHELGHHLDFKYDLWNLIVDKSEDVKVRVKIKEELRKLSDLTWEGQFVTASHKKYARKKAEKMAHLLEAYVHAPELFKKEAPTVNKVFKDFLKTKEELKPLVTLKRRLSLTEVTPRSYQVVSKGGHGYTKSDLTKSEAKEQIKGIQENIEEYRRSIGLIEDISVAAPTGLASTLSDITKFDFMKEMSLNPDWVWQDSLVKVDGKRMGIGKLEEEIATQKKIVEQAPNVPEAQKRLETMESAMAEATAKTDKVPSDFIQLPVDKAYGDLSGAYLRKEIALDIQPVVRMFSDSSQFGKIVNAGIKAEEQLVAAFKVGKVALNPPTIARNILSNQIQLNMSGIPLHKLPMYWTKAAMAMKNKSQYYNEARRQGIFRTNWALTEIDEVLDTVKTMEKDGYAGILGSIGKLAKFYGKIDDFFKLLKYIEQREGGASKGKASREAQKWVMDYSRATPSIKFARKHLLPMVTFQYKIVPLIAESLYKRPWVIAKYAMIPYLMQEMAKKNLDIDGEEWEKLQNQLPQYVRESGVYTLYPVRSPEGNLQWVNLEYYVPWQGMIGLHQMVKKGDYGELAAGMIRNPIVDVWASYKGVRGDEPPKDMFTSREVYNRLDTPTTKALKTSEWLVSKWAPSAFTRRGALDYTLNIGNKDRYGRSITKSQAAGKWVGFNIVSPTPKQVAFERLRRMKEIDKAVFKVIADPTNSEKYKKQIRAAGKKQKEIIREYYSKGD